MKLNDLVQHISHTGASETDITAITYDSRKACAGSLFVCLVGAWLDGHTYAESAYQNGCRAFLVEHRVDLPADAVQIVTDDTRAALAVIGADFYGNPADELHLIGITGTKGKTTTALLTAAIMTEAGLPCAYIGSNGVDIAGVHEATANTTPESLELHLIGITGTKGKTTTALLTAAIMTEAGLPCAYIGSNGVDIAGVHEATANTTPESLELHRLFRKMLDAGVRHCVLEVSSQALRHHRVDGVPFEVVAFTNLSEDHIGPGEHPDFEDYKCAKRRLFAEYNARTMVYNVDDPYSDFMREGFKGEQISFGIQNAADYHGQNLAQYRSQTALGVDFDCVHAGETTHIEVMSPGTFSASDALCAVALCGAFGVTPAQAAATLAHTPVQGRFEVVEGLPGRTFIVDYSHNGLALTSALKTLRAYNPHRLLCVFGSVGGRTQVRRKELADASSAYADYTIITSDNPDNEPPEDVIRDIAGHMALGAPYTCITDRREAIYAAVKMAEPGDIVLFAGKGHEDYQLVNGKKLHFVEREIIKEACAEISK